MTETFHAGPGLGRLSDVTIIHGDCIDAMAELAADSVDAIVTDPPYGLGFMGKAWDDLPPGLDWAKQCLRVLKPGGHLLAFGGTRTWHRLAVAVEDAGFEIRDSIAYMHTRNVLAEEFAELLGAWKEWAERVPHAGVRFAGGLILDPFAGSGTTVEAALLEDFRVIGIEREVDYLAMIQQRIVRCLVT